MLENALIVQEEMKNAGFQVNLIVSFGMVEVTLTNRKPSQMEVEIALEKAGLDHLTAASSNSGVLIKL